MLTQFIPLLIGVVSIILLFIMLAAIYKVAPADKALVITGGKKLKIKVSGGSFVIPFFRKASYFDLCMLTVPADGDEIRTSTAIPIVVDWTAQIRPNSKNIDILQKAIISFNERGKDEIARDVKLTLMGAVRGVVATMTPEQVQYEKETFKQLIIDSVSDELADMGLELVSLNIQDITDNNGYYRDIATNDREQKRKEAEKIKAITSQEIRQQTAESERIARQSELDMDLQVAEKTKDNNLKKAAFKIETDKALADAEIAGDLQKTIRQQEVAEQEGRVEGVRQEQANLAAQKEKEVIKTRAEAEKIQAEIKAEEIARVNVIDAESRTKVTEQQAKMSTINAEAQARVMEQEAIGKAKAIEKEAAANANKIRLEGETQAEIIAKQGNAEAEAIKAKKLAEAEGEKALAEARSGNDKVNFEIEKLKIEANARIEIATKTASIMADLGKNAEFINIGGSSGNNDNVLMNTIGQVPELIKKLNVTNQALNGKEFNETIRDAVTSITEPLRGLGLLSTNNSIENTTIENAPVDTADKKVKSKSKTE